MRRRNELIEKLRKDTLEKIKYFSNPENQKYKDFMKKLIIQGLVKMLEPVCLVQVRKVDSEFVKRMMKDIEEEFSQLMKEQTGEEFKTVIDIDTEYLEKEL